MCLDRRPPLGASRRWTYRPRKRQGPSAHRPSKCGSTFLFATLCEDRFGSRMGSCQRRLPEAARSSPSCAARRSLPRRGAPRRGLGAVRSSARPSIEPRRDAALRCRCENERWRVNATLGELDRTRGRTPFDGVGTLGQVIPRRLLRRGSSRTAPELSVRLRRKPSKTTLAGDVTYGARLRLRE
jgi:hypothetical protein